MQDYSVTDKKPYVFMLREKNVVVKHEKMGL